MAAVSARAGASIGRAGAGFIQNLEFPPGDCANSVVPSLLPALSLNLFSLLLGGVIVPEHLTFFPFTALSRLSTYLHDHTCSASISDLLL